MKWIVYIIFGLLSVFFLVISAEAMDMKNCVKWTPGHYVYLTPRIQKNNLENFIAGLDNVFKGVQVKVSWRDLEVDKDHYDFEQIDSILRILKKYDKKLFLQVQERSFKEGQIPIPDYLLKESQYHGGATPLNAPYRLKKGKQVGSVAKIWNANILDRFNLLIKALGNRYDDDNFFEGINFPETALSIDRKETEDFTTELYLEALKLRLSEAKRAFRHSVVIQYVNYMEKSEMEKFIQYCYETGVGIGGPDLVPDRGRHKNKARIPAYDYYPTYNKKMPLGVAVQLPNFTHKKGIFSLDDFWEMGVNTLKLNYIFWAAVEGRQFTHSFSKDIVPYVKKKSGGINSVCPENLGKCCR